MTDPTNLDVTGYVTHHNVGTNMRGTAILARCEFPLTNITTLPSGRAIAGGHNGIRLVNLYAPSGTARRDREFFNAELPDLLYTKSHSMITGGDFNCVLQPVDTTGHFPTSRALTDIFRGLTH
jgi:exonuclease III